MKYEINRCCTVNEISSYVYYYLIVFFFLYCKGYCSPHWGKAEYRPCWWPQEIPFVSPYAGSMSWLKYFVLLLNCKLFFR